MNSEQLRHTGLRYRNFVIESNLTKASTSLGCQAAAGVIHEYMAHHLRCQIEKVPAVFVVGRLSSYEPEISFIHESGGT